MLGKPVLGNDAVDSLRREMDVNVFGLLEMANAFAPVLERNGGGALVNMLSVVSWYVYPFNSTYCATKHAALAITDGLRIQLKSQGTQVIGVFAGFIDTDMGNTLFAGDKTSPRPGGDEDPRGHPQRYRQRSVRCAVRAALECRAYEPRRAPRADAGCVG